MTFAEFMELALYWPNGGYYRGHEPTGAQGDFYTAPGAHPAFGALLCLQMYQTWRLLDRPRPFWVVEAGAGRGLLCHDLVGFAAHLPGDFRQALRYLCLDLRASPGLEGKLTPPGAPPPQRLAALGLPLASIVGCVLSNELLDAFPVHRVETRNGTLMEVYVTLENGELTEELAAPSTPALARRLDDLGVTLPEGRRAEINLAAAPWLREAAQAIQRGYLLTIDYGREAGELYSAARPRGSLTTFHRHVQTDNPYVHLGRQDITSQVDFSTLASLGKGLGLEPLAYLHQGRFLTNLGLRRWIGGLTALGLDQRQRDANRMGMLELARPGGMGEFRVLVQGKNAPEAPLWGVKAAPELEELQRRLPVPLLTPLHAPLMQGRYPLAAAGFRGFTPS